MQPHRKIPSRLESQLALASGPLLGLARQITGQETWLVRADDSAGALPPANGGDGCRTFWASPSSADENARLSFCGARQLDSPLSPPQATAMNMIAESLQMLFEAERDACLAREREQLAEMEAIQARNEAKRHATGFLHMERLAHTDELTGLLNRRAFMERWEDESVRSADRGYSIALIVIDADRFKRVNDTFGHQQGDVVLCAIGATLLAVARPPDIVARLGGDEFALVTTHAASDELLEIAGEIIARFGILAAELGVDTTLSIGIASSLDCDRGQMLAQADAALYRSKAADGNEAQMFVPRASSFALQDAVHAEALPRRALR